jgi:hypothetical protein
LSRKLKVRSGHGTGNLGGLLGGLGRLALWLAVALLLVRGAGAVLAAPSTSSPDLRISSPDEGQALDAFAVRFARVYLADPTATALRPLLAPGASIAASGRPAPTPLALAQAVVVGSAAHSGGESVLTVACEMADGSVRYLAVPLRQDRAGRVAALGLPAAVPAPAPSPLEAERLPPVAGPEAGEIAALVDRFLPIYVAATSAAEYSYLLAPGAAVAPLGGEFTVLGTPSVRQRGEGEGPRREVVATVRLQASDGAVYPLAYRLDLIRRERWYVAAIEGELR